jgi:lysophospholipase L1-like esterase
MWNAVCIWGVLAVMSHSQTPTVRPCTPAGLAVEVGAGHVTLPTGQAVRFAGRTLTFNPPESRRDSTLNNESNIEVDAPGDYAPWFAPWSPWPTQGQPVTLMPRVHTPENPLAFLLGGLYRAIPPESVMVRSGDGKTVFVRDVDYKFNADWGQVANLNNRLSSTIRVDYTYFMQRIDLIQVDAAGKLSVKKGLSQPVCPHPPSLDPGCAGLAGVYIARFDGYAVTAQDICLFGPPMQTAPVNRQAVATTLARLAKQQPVKIAFMGDSFSLGCEAGEWWSDASRSFRSLLVSGLQVRYPGAAVSEVASGAYTGGANAAKIVENFNRHVLPARPDLVVICYGQNDAGGPLNGPPSFAPDSFKQVLEEAVVLAKTNTMDVILMSHYRAHPFFEAAQRIDQYRRAMLELAQKYGVGFADLLTAWDNQKYSGYPPFTELHNNHNHPGVRGHKLTAELLLEFFREK